MTLQLELSGWHSKTEYMVRTTSPPHALLGQNSHGMPAYNALVL